MKRTFTFLSPSRPTGFFALVAIIGCSLLSSFASTLSAQVSASAAPGDPITTDAYPQAEWKAPTEYSAILTTEKANAAVILATPNLKVAQRALYTGYDRLLSYMQADLSANEPIEDIALNNYKKVVLESASDPLITDMEPSEFSALYNVLVVMLRH